MPGSLHNYLAMTSGLTSVDSPSQANIFQAIDDSGGADTWTSFQESMAGNCGQGSAARVPGTSVHLYDQGHDPAYHLRRDESCAKNDIPMTTASFNPAALPTFSFITPNTCDDMHTLPTGGRPCPAYFGSNPGSNVVKMGDNWLRVVVPRLLAQPDVTVVITWDEGTSSEHVVTLEVGAGVTAGFASSSPYNHYGLEAGLLFQPRSREGSKPRRNGHTAAHSLTAQSPLQAAPPASSVALCEHSATRAADTHWARLTEWTEQRR